MLGVLLASTQVGAQQSPETPFESSASLDRRLEQLDREVQLLRAQALRRQDVSPAEFVAQGPLPLEEPLAAIQPQTDQPTPVAGDFPPGRDMLPATASQSTGPDELEPLTVPEYFALQNADEPPEFPTVRLTGFFHLDAGWIDQDALNRVVLGEDLDNGINFRRTRLAATGNVTAATQYMIEMDFAEGQPRFVDVWMDFDKGGHLGNLRIGRFRQPFGMSELTSVRELAFLERPLPFALGPFRQTGVMIYNHSTDERLTWASSLYALTDAYGNLYSDTGGWATATRLTFLPYYVDDGDYLIHLGVNYAYSDAVRNLVGYNSRPEFFLDENVSAPPSNFLPLPNAGIPPFVNTGLIPARHSNLFNVEAAAAIGRLYLQSEARWAVVDRIGSPQEAFPGLYAQARYVLTGEKLPYNTATGVFGRIVPRCPVHTGASGGLGAWEAAVRWSYLDLNAPALPGPGRRLNDITVGMNWYLNRYAKFQFNYIHSLLDDPVLDESQVNIWALRGQVDF
jgi:phosphate-selective porin OprO/OprP